MKMIRITNVTTKRTVDVNLEQRGAETVQCVMEQAREAFGASRIRRLVVGDLVIPRDDWDRHSVDTYMLLGEPWMVECSSNDFELRATGLSGEVMVLQNLGPQNTVGGLRDEIAKVSGLNKDGIDSLRILFGGKQLSDDKSTLKDCNLRPGCVIQIIHRMVGGGDMQCMPMGAPFVNIDEHSLPSRHEWSTTAPSWRIAKHGLCIEGTCTNRRCESKGSLVIVNFGYTTFSLLEDAHQCSCPACKSHVDPVTCGFNNCYWSLYGRKCNTPSEPPTTIKITEKHADNAWHHYDPNENGTTQWLTLLITAKRERKQRERFPWGHSFHARCAGMSPEGQCCQESMTEFQRSRSAV